MTGRNKLEDSLLIEIKLRRWETAQVFLRKSYTLGAAASLILLVPSLLEVVHSYWLVITLVAWLPVMAAWGFVKFQVNKLGDRLHHAEFLEKFYAISRKYQERTFDSGKQD